MRYEIVGQVVDVVEVDNSGDSGEVGYDIYIDEADDPVNLGDVVYFDHEPTRQDIVDYLASKVIIGGEMV